MISKVFHRALLFWWLVTCSTLSFAQGSNERQVREYYDLWIAAYDNEKAAWQSVYDIHLEEGHQYYKTQGEFNDRANELRGEVERCSNEIGRLTNEKELRIREAQERDRQQAEQYRIAQQRQQVQHQDEQAQQQTKYEQKQREQELEDRRERERREREWQRREDEKRRQIRYQNDYNEQIARTARYYANKKDEASWMASRNALNEMYNSFRSSRLIVSIDDVPHQSSQVQLTQSSGVDRIKERLARNNQTTPLYEDGFFNDKVFESLNEDVFLNSADLVWRKANKSRVQQYWERINREDEPSADYPLAYTEWLYSQFKELSGYDVKQILAKSYRTDDEKQALLDFNMFSTQLLNETEKELNAELRTLDLTPDKQLVDMAILSSIPYGTNNGYLRFTDYKLISPESAPNEIKDIAKMIELCNNDSYGFHAQLFYNDKTNTYTISYEGSSDPDLFNLVEEYKRYLIANNIEAFENITGLDWGIEYIFKDVKHSEAFKDWILTNSKQGLYGIPEQFKLVGSIAEMINRAPNVDLKLTGHSLGGGLAGFCGLLTGRETTTFNAEGVNWNIIWEGGQEARQRAVFCSNITAYHDREDKLTWAQQNTPLTTALGKEVIIDVDSKYKTSFIEKRTGHMIVPMVKQFLDQDSKELKRWNEIKSIKDKYRESFMELSLCSLAAQ